jgi:putative heme iron utilization protein
LSRHLVTSHDRRPFPIGIVKRIYDGIRKQKSQPPDFLRKRRRLRLWPSAFPEVTTPRMPNEHGRPGDGGPPGPAAPAVRAPTHAERCRTLAIHAKSATLATIARDPAGFPYASLVTIAFDRAGRPLLLLSELAEHTGNLHARPEASVLVSEPLGTHTEPLALGRVTILGPCVKVPDDERASVREIFVREQPTSARYVEFRDFAFYRLEPAALRYVGGFGRMSWVAIDEYRIAEPDPLAASAAGILQHMNDDHADAVLAYARALATIAEATTATMTAVDRYGFEIAAATPSGPRAGRIAFDAPVATPEEVRRAMVDLVKRARAGAPA